MESTVNLRNRLLSANPNESTPLSRAIFFVIIGVAFYLLDRFSLFIVDDYMYAFKYGTYEPIKTLKDIFESQCDHYMELNGRFLVHCVVQLFCGILGVEWFRLFNTIMFVLFCGLSTRIICKTWKVSLVWYIITSFALWCFIPRIGFTVLGNIACCVNYLWVGVATLAFVVLHSRVSEHPDGYSQLGNIGLALAGMVVGSLQESFSVPVAGALFVYYCFNFKKFRGPIAWLVVGYWIGALVLVLAPGNFVRLHKSVSSEGVIMASIRRFIAIFSEYWLLVVAVVVHLVMMCYGRIRARKFITDNLLQYLMLLIGLAFTIVVAYTGEHQLFFIGWLIIFTLVRLMYGKLDGVFSKKYELIIAILLCCFGPMYYSVYNYRENDYRLRENLICAIKESEDGDVPAGDYIAAQINKNKLATRYTFRIGYEPKMYYTSLYHTGDDAHLKNFIPCRKTDLFKKLTDNNLVSSNIWYLSEYKCYVIKWSGEYAQGVRAVYPIKGISAIKRQLFNEPLSIPYVITKDQLDDSVVYDGDEYSFYYVALNGSVIEMNLI